MNFHVRLCAGEERAHVFVTNDKLSPGAENSARSDGKLIVVIGEFFFGKHVHRSYILYCISERDLLYANIMLQLRSLMNLYTRMFEKKNVEWKQKDRENTVCYSREQEWVDCVC